MVTNQGFKKVRIELTLINISTSEQTIKKFVRTSVPSGVGDPINGDDFSDILALVPETHTGSIKIIENGIAQVDRTHVEVADADEIKDNLGSLYTQVTD